MIRRRTRRTGYGNSRAVGHPRRVSAAPGGTRAVRLRGKAALLGPEAAEWKGALTRLGHDVYHLPEYVTLDARLSGGTPAAFRYGEAGRVLLLPLVLRPVPGAQVRDAVSPYGYPGPVSDADVSAVGFWTRACRAMVALLRAQGVVTVFVRLHPLLPAPIVALERVGAVVRHGETVSVDLSLSVDEMWRQTRRDHRKDISRARRAEVSVVLDDWSRLDEWLATYHDNMRRVGASAYYFFSGEHFHALRCALGDRVHLAVAVAQGEVVGGSVFFEYRGILQGYVQSTRGERTYHADKLLYDEIRRWGKDRGDAVYHFGGGVGGANDSLFAYKAGFSPRRHDFHTWRIITDPDRFAGLLGADAGSAAVSSTSGYFPPYR